MRLAICDDDREYLEAAVCAAKEFADLHPEISFEICPFSHGEDLAEAARRTGGFEVYILDIVMPHIDGIELGKTLRREGYGGKIIYLTTSEEFAIESYQVRAHDYLMKPLKKAELFAALEEITEHFKSTDTKSIIIKTKENSVKLTFDSIMYAELVKRAVRYHLTSGQTVESVSARTPFPETVSALTDDERFVSCGQSMIANLRHVTMVEGDAIVFKEKYRIPLGVKNCREVRSAWTKFWFNGGSEN